VKKLIKRTFGLSGIYALGDIFVKGIGFLLLPLYTAYLTPNDYGVLAIAFVVNNISTAVLSLGLNGAAFKFYYDLRGEQRKRFYGTLWLFFLTVPSVTLLLIELTGKGFCGRLITKVSYDPYLRIALWLSFLTVAFTNFCRELLKASERAIAYVLINAGQSILVIGLSIWLVVGLRKGAQGALLAQLFGVGIMACICIFILWKYISLGIDLPLLKKALLFGLPLMPHFLAHWVLGASDKVILERYVPLSEVGVYSVGYLLGSMMIIFATACNNAILPLFGRAKPCGYSEARILARITTYYILVLTFVGLCLSLFSKEIVQLFTTDSYKEAALIVPWIVLGYFFMGLYCIPMNAIVQITGNSKSIPFFTVTAAILNIVLNILLIPKIGMIAAALTTAASYFLMFAGVFFLAYKTVRLPYEYYRISKIFLSAILIYATGEHLSQNNIWMAIVTKLLLLSCFPVFLWLIGFLNEQEHRTITNFVKKCQKFGMIPTS
jgi:O-antigen/teichoic acid export membrane protein